MLNIRRSETFTTKFDALSPLSQSYFLTRFYEVWKDLLDIHATGEKHYIDVEESISGSDKNFIAFYSKADNAIFLDIT